MREFSKVSPAVWASSRFVGLHSDDAKLLYLYLLTCRHQTSAGCYELPDAYGAYDLKWDLERYGKAREALVAADLIRYDSKANVVMICRWFRHNPPMSADHVKGVQRQLEGIPSTELRPAALEALLEAWEEVKAIRMAKAEAKLEPSTKPAYRKAGPPSPEVMTFVNKQSRWGE